jgi:hypothetical protein
MSANPMAISGFKVWTHSIYVSFDRGWNPTEVKSQMLWSVLPAGADTAGVRRGARSVVSDEGRAVKVCRGVLFRGGQFMIGGVPLGAFSVTGGYIRLCFLVGRECAIDRSGP